MSTNSQDQEIDLGQIRIGIKKFFNGIINSIFDVIFFVKKKIIVIGTLFLIGIVLGFFIDKNPVYTQDMTVIPIFGFVNMRDNEQNFELIKLMAEDGKIDEIIKSDITSKNYYLHNITFQTAEKINQNEVIDPLLKYLQDNSFYKTHQKIYQENTNDKIKFNDSLIKQIDGLIVKLSDNNSGSNVSISENKGISELINKKNELVIESQYLKIHKHEYEDIIKTQNVSLNNVNTKGLNNKMKLILPVLFVFLYLGFYKFSSLYKKQLARINS